MNCGDGIKLTNENCDDGDKTDNKGCLSDCTGSIPGWQCSSTGINFAPDLCSFICGDSKVVLTEVCDDGTNDG